MRRALRSLLPPAALALLSIDGQEPLPAICMSASCLNKIKAGEKNAREGNDWLRGIERDLSQQGRLPPPIAGAVVNEKGAAVGLDAQEGQVSIGYGQYDTRTSISSYKSSLRNMPPPTKARGTSEQDKAPQQLVTDILSDLPASCMLPYYESRRRWIFGGTGATTRGLHVDGVNNDGVNVLTASKSADDEPLIALAGVGAESVNQTSISIMGDFRERLHYSRAPLTGYGGSNATGSAITTAPDGEPVSSVDDDVFPLAFFTGSGEFIDSPQARTRARLSINFGNPFDEKRGGSIVPDKFEAQRPSTPPGSPPHDELDVVEDEGEGEAAFTGKRPSSPAKSPRHMASLNLLKRKTSDDSDDHTSSDHVDGTSEPKEAKKTRLNPPPPPKMEGQKRQSSLPHPARKPAPPTPAQQSKTKPPPPKRQNSDEEVKAHQEPMKQMPPVSEPLQLQNPNQKPDVELPTGWMSVWSKSQKRWYFFDTRTNKSVWEWPPPGMKSY